MAYAQVTRLSDWRFVCPGCGQQFEINEIRQHWHEVQDVAHRALHDARLRARNYAIASADIDFIVSHCNRVTATPADSKEKRQ